MDPPRFTDYYRWMLQSFIYWGMPTPWLPKLPKSAWWLLVIYDILTLLLICFALCIFVFTIACGNLGFQDVTVLLPGFVFYTSALYLSLYQYLIKGRLEKIAADVDAIAREIIGSKLGLEKELLQVYSDNSKNIIYYCRLLPCLYVSSSTIFFCSVPIVDWFEGNYRTNFAISIVTPFDYRQPGIYEFVVLLLTTALFISTCKQLNNALFFLAFFNTLRSYLKYLYLSMDELQNNIIKEDYTLTRQSIRTWIKIHQEINRCLQVLLQLFSPIIIVNCMYILVYLVGALFLQTQEKRNNIYQTFSAFIGVMGTVIQVYMIFNIADHVTFEARDLANAVYGLPWYEMDKRTKREVQMIITMCNRPIHVTGYRTNALILNRETLTAIMTSALSAYLTLCQMKEAFGPEESTAQ
ncbi:odorant receptor 94b-like [Halyomorpha halys]|uniref:odorant receptor 94b-like n=1 Tax=Halyomorpha halys TaxID=286706 RepID=UPI0034D27145|nr:Odorant receptor 100 [Halyomorpha halys]